MVLVISLNADIFAVKLGGMILCVMGQLVYMLNIKPYASKSLGILEYFNEFILLMCAYMLPSFTGLIPDIKANYKFGWVFCYILIPFFIFNIAFLVTTAVRLLIKGWKDRQIRLAYEKSEEGKKQKKIDKMYAQKGEWQDIKPKKVINKKLSRAEKLAKEMKEGEDFLEKAMAADELRDI
jgi:hypothetical protein